MAFFYLFLLMRMTRPEVIFTKVLAILISIECRTFPILYHWASDTPIHICIAKSFCEYGLWLPKTEDFFAYVVAL